ncbi:MAG: hypothetical protein K2X47_03895, partial [Bdellovibrionales bacterium]|nr:hypothetical protein [Bdellovibrionales bacterium]
MIKASALLHWIVLSLSVLSLVAPKTGYCGPTAPTGFKAVIPLFRDNLLLEKLSASWDVAIVDRAGGRRPLKQFREIYSLSQFEEGPATQPFWRSISVRSSQGLEELKGWFFFQSDEGFHFVQRGLRTENPFAIFSFPALGVATAVSAGQIRFKGNHLFLYSIEYTVDQQGRMGQTILVDPSTGKFHVVANKFIRLMNGDDDLYSLSGSELSFPGAKINVSLDQLDRFHTGNVGLNVMSGALPAKAAHDTEIFGRGPIEKTAPSQNPVGQPENVTGTGFAQSATSKAQVVASAPVEIRYVDDTYSVYVDTSNENRGTYVRRNGDGKVVKISTSAVGALQAGNPPKSLLHVENGILSHKKLPRKIDLEKFNIEARWIPTLSEEDAINDHDEDDGVRNQQKGANKAPKVNLIRWLETTFQDVRGDGKRRVKPVKSRRELVEQMVGKLTASGKASSVYYG